MMIARYIDRHGGLATTEELLRRGEFWESLIQQSVAYGSIIRVRRGWYATPETHPAIIEACLARGRLTCVSARQLRAGEEVTHPLHVAVAPTSSRLPDRPRVIRHWTQGNVEPGECWAAGGPDETATAATP